MHETGRPRVALAKTHAIPEETIITFGPGHVQSVSAETTPLVSRPPKLTLTFHLAPDTTHVGPKPVAAWRAGKLDTLRKAVRWGRGELFNEIEVLTD